MKKHIYTLTLLMLLVAACNRSNHNETRYQNPHTPDSLWRLTGDANLDSLLKDAATNLQMDHFKKIHDDIIYNYMSTDIEKGKEYCLHLKNLNEYLDWNAGRFMYTSGFARILISVNQNDSALVFLQQALEFAEIEENETWKAYIYFSMGNAYVNKNWNKTSLTYMMQALPRFEEINSHYLPHIYCNMGALYRNINMKKEAIEYGEKAIELSAENPYYLSQLGISYIYQHQYEQGKHYMEEALHYATLQNFTNLSGFIYIYLGNIAYLVFDLNKAELYARKALEIYQDIENISNFCAVYLLLGKVEQLRGHFTQSEGYVHEALKIASDTNDLPLLKNCYLTLSELSIAQQKFREYIQYQREWELTETALTTETAVLAAAEMSAKYETSKKELEIDRQKSVIARQNMQRWLLVTGIAIAIVFLVLLWRILLLRNRSNHALAEMNHAKDKFFSIISHDLKNPAIAQRDALRILVNNGRLWNTDTLCDYYSELLNSAEDEVELIYNLLDWARLQTGRMTCTPETFNLAALLHTDISLARTMSEKKEITFATAIPDMAQIIGDGNMISTVVRNLLTNAVKFTDAGGTVSLDITPCGNVADNVSAKTRRIPAYTVSVSDTGLGMSPERLRNIFHIESHQLRKGTAGEQGSGLGLMVCRELLEKHRTTLHAESEEGKGSRFWFEI